MQRGYLQVPQGINQHQTRARVRLQTEQIDKICYISSEQAASVVIIHKRHQFDCKCKCCCVQVGNNMLKIVMKK